MVITLVIDQLGFSSNGTTISTQRYARALIKRGHEVRIIGACPPDYKIEGAKIYHLPERYIPIVSTFGRMQGFVFPKLDREMLTTAIKGADVVHLIAPFKFEKIAMKIAKELNIPFTAAFHIQPENCTYNIKLGKWEKLNKFIYKFFNKKLYKYQTHIHCPSNFIADELKKNGYTAKLHVVSNGVDADFKKEFVEKPEKFKDKFCIVFTGRYSPEKRHDLLIKAIKKSKYADKIQLFCLGKGPMHKKLVKMGETLPNKPIFDRVPTEELVKIINFSDLYVHPADIEIEAIACVEAFSCGLVPLISDSNKSATKQFALSAQNIFYAGNSYDLSRKIDFFVEHPKFKENLSKQYIEYGKQFLTDLVIENIEKMFEEAIKEHSENVEA